jgi:hypothetical protein
MVYEQMRATDLFDSTKLVSELPRSFAYHFDDSNTRLDNKMKNLMLAEEQKAIEYLAQLADLKNHPLD